MLVNADREIKATVCTWNSQSLLEPSETDVAFWKYFMR